jgi:hypothetical protein
MMNDDWSIAYGVQHFCFHNEQVRRLSVRIFVSAMNCYPYEFMSVDIYGDTLLFNKFIENLSEGQASTPTREIPSPQTTNHTKILVSAFQSLCLQVNVHLDVLNAVIICFEEKRFIKVKCQAFENTV